MNDRPIAGQPGPVRSLAGGQPSAPPGPGRDALSPSPVADDAAAPPTAETARVDPGPRLAGVIDLLRPDRIAGWAVDRADAGARLDIEILRDGAPAVTIRADRPRPDLARGGIGDGGYGFAVDLAPPLEPGFEFTIVARARAADGATVELRRAGPAEPAPSAEVRLLQRLHRDLAALREAALAPPPPAPAPASGAELMRAAERIETALARIEAVMATQPVAPPPRPARGVRGLAAAALAVAALSLGAGVWSAFGDRPLPASTLAPPD